MARSTDDLFSALLKAFRKQRHLTQQQLARALGVHLSAIGRWERGDYLPESRTMVLELARQLKLDEHESRQLLEASLTASSPHWSVPLPRNPYFTGRAEILEALHTQLGAEQAVALTQSSALSGLGGIGKTQIALEYAYRHALEYSAVFWVGAETDESIVASLQRIAEVLQLPERADNDQQRVVAAVQRWLSTHSQWLLIWDNLEDLTLLDQFLPSTRSGVLLLTTRLQALGTFAQGLDLEPMEQEEALLFLLRRAKVLSPGATRKQVQERAAHRPEDDRCALELVTLLGNLPLALDQAGAYLEETQCGLGAYLELFRSRSTILLASRGERSREHPESVWTTFTLAITAVSQRDPAVGDLLRLCAFLQPDAIPEEVFRQGAAHVGALLEAVGQDDLGWNRVLALACGYSLLTRDPEEQLLSLHRLVQAVLREQLDEGERRLWSQRAMQAVNAAFPAVAYETWGQCERLLPQALGVAQRIEQEQMTTQEAARLLSETASYLQERGRHAEAEPLFQRALAIWEQQLGPEHPLVATSLNNLAALYYRQGKYAEVEPLLQRALYIQEQQLGPEHPEVATSLNDLANLYRYQGKYAGAEPLYQRALAIREQQLGPEHPLVTHPLNGLAFLYYRQGEYAEVELLLQRALHIQEQQLGPEHPGMPMMLNNLAELYAEQGKYAEAEPLYQRAVRIREQQLGSEHLAVAYPLNGLARLYCEQGKYAEAEPLFQRVLAAWEQQLGPDHSDIAHPLNGLANLYRDCGRHAEAEPLYQRALAIREQQLGPEHPDTAETLHDLATLREQQGNSQEALALYERALAIRKQSLVPTHPQTRATRERLAALRQVVQQHDQAEKSESSQAHAEEIPDSLGKAGTLRGIVPAPHEPAGAPPSKHDPFQEFLDACCDLHPHAWCRISDLWEAYEQWGAERQERFLLSRRAFAAKVKAHGCSPDRTSTARIWRGIALRNARGMTLHDKK